MKSLTATLFRGLCVVVLLAVNAAGGQAQTGATKITWKGRAAYRLTHGTTEAIIVPALGSRLMVFRFTGGRNALWNAPDGTVFKKGEWANWGGEKAWPSLQSDWPLFQQPSWPPHPTYDSLPHQARILPDGRLETVGPVMAGWGVRSRRVFGYDRATGELVITTTFTKVVGEPRFIAAWNVVQIPPPDIIYLPVNPNSPYRDSAYWFGGVKPKEANPTEVGDDGLLTYRPTVAGGYKFGTDAPAGNAAAVKGDLALIVRSAKKPGSYPEGAEGSGFPVTLWNNGADTPGLRYNEIEVMSPLTNVRRGQSFSHVLRLRLLRLPNAEPSSPASRAAVRAALR